MMGKKIEGYTKYFMEKCSEFNISKCTQIKVEKWLKLYLSALSFKGHNGA